MIEVVCGVILDRRGGFLACQRPPAASLGGLWEFPGGKIDAGESPQAALQRELREELALETTIGAALSPVEWHYEHASILLRPYLCTIARGEPRPLEHTAIRWCGHAEAAALDWAPADLPVLEELRSLGQADA